MAAEVRLLRERRHERYAAADLLLWIPTAAGELAFLAVQVDGAQHFDTAHAFAGQSVEEQQARDASFDAAAAAQGFAVARLHHLDQPEFGKVLAAALQLLRTSSRPFTFFSRSYPKPLTAGQPGTVDWR